MSYDLNEEERTEEWVADGKLATHFWACRLVVSRQVQVGDA
jgi:hypothetical protein